MKGKVSKEVLNEGCPGQGMNLDRNMKGKVSRKKRGGLKRDVVSHQGGLSSGIPL